METKEMIIPQGWKPDWTSANENKYCIINKFNKITEFTF